MYTYDSVVYLFQCSEIVARSIKLKLKQNREKQAGYTTNWILTDCNCLIKSGATKFFNIFWMSRRFNGKYMKLILGGFDNCKKSFILKSLYKVLENFKSCYMMKPNNKITGDIYVEWVYTYLIGKYMKLKENYLYFLYSKTK